MYTWKHYAISIIKNNHFTIEKTKNGTKFTNYSNWNSYLNDYRILNCKTSILSTTKMTKEKCNWKIKTCGYVTSQRKDCTNFTRISIQLQRLSIYRKMNWLYSFWRTFYMISKTNSIFGNQKLKFKLKQEWNSDTRLS